MDERMCVCGGGGTLVSVYDGRGCGMSHIWSCLATARSCFHLSQRAPVWISLRERRLCGGGIESGTDQGMFPERKEEEIT